MTGLTAARSTIVGGFRRAGAVVRLLVVTQLLFNVGFFMVLPYLAVHLSEDLAQGAAVVGAVLGARTFSQQGLFVVGGMLADRLGTRPVVLLGCACRVVGFVALGLSGSLVGVAAGAVLTGFAGALFSPAVEAALARAAVDPDPAPPSDRADRDRTDRLDAFALFTAFGQVGTFLGPLVGSALLLVDFAAACLVAAGLFVVIGLAHLRWLPHDRSAPPDGPRSAAGSGWRRVLGDRAFLAFALVMSTQLVGYNQLYLLLPFAVDRAWGSQAPLGILFGAASLLVVAGQLPVASAIARLRPAPAVRAGLLTMAAGFAVAACGVAAGLRGAAAVAVLGAFVIVFTCGQMIVGPTTRSLIPNFAENRWLGSYYGAFASVAGLAVLPSSIATGAMMDAAPSAGAGAATPWVVMTVLLLAAAAAVTAVVTGDGRARRGSMTNGR